MGTKQDDKSNEEVSNINTPTIPSTGPKQLDNVSSEVTDALFSAVVQGSSHRVHSSRPANDGHGSSGEELENSRARQPSITANTDSISSSQRKKTKKQKSGKQGKDNENKHVETNQSSSTASNQARGRPVQSTIDTHITVGSRGSSLKRSGPTSPGDVMQSTHIPRLSTPTIP